MLHVCTPIFNLEQKSLSKGICLIGLRPEYYSTIQYYSRSTIFQTVESRDVPDDARLQGGGDGEGFVDVAGEHAGRQPVVRGVRSRHHFLQAAETHDLLHRTEDLKPRGEAERRGGRGPPLMTMKGFK